MTIHQCSGTTKNGARCSRKLLSGTHCYQHKDQEAPVIVQAPQRQPPVEKKKRSSKKVNACVPKHEETKECCICLEEDSNKFIEFSCKHSFHETCVSQLRRYDCPMCRKNIAKELPSSVVKQIRANRAKDEAASLQRYQQYLPIIREIQREYNRTGDYSNMQSILMNLR